MRFYKFISDLNESSKFIKVMKYLTGQKDDGKGIAIFTSQNPGKELTSKENKKIFNELKDLLKKKRYTYFEQIGVYGGFEKSIVVIDISKQDAKYFSDMYKQDSFIWGNDGKYIMVRGNREAPLTKIDIDGNPKKQIEDMFSQVKGRKYQMDFDFPEDFWD